MLSMPQIVAVGEALTDMIRVGSADGSEEHWLAKTGGSTWNVARAAAAFGLRSAFAGSISQCCFGDALWRDSEAAGLNLRFMQRVDRSPLLAMVPQVKPPRYFFVGDNSADLAFDPELLPEQWSVGAAWVHFGGISLAREPLAQRLIDLASTLHAAGTRISYDPNYRNTMGTAYRTTFERMCRLARAVKLSDEDLAGLLPELAPSKALQLARSWNPNAWWLYTEGASGAQLLTPGGDWNARPPAVEVIDTVGAGDASVAGLLVSLTRRPEADGACHLAYAIAAGSAACMSAGAHPPPAHVVQALFEQITPVAVRSST